MRLANASICRTSAVSSSFSKKSRKTSPALAAQLLGYKIAATDSRLRNTRVTVASRREPGAQTYLGGPGRAVLHFGPVKKKFRSLFPKIRNCVAEKGRNATHQTRSPSLYESLMLRTFPLHCFTRNEAKRSGTILSGRAKAVEVASMRRRSGVGIAPKEYSSYTMADLPKRFKSCRI